MHFNKKQVGLPVSTSPPILVRTVVLAGNQWPSFPINFSALTVLNFYFQRKEKEKSAFIAAILYECITEEKPDAIKLYLSMKKVSFFSP
jgi:hypothetical protein